MLTVLGVEEAVGAGLTGLVVWTSLEEVEEGRGWVVVEERAALEEEEEGRRFRRSPNLATVFRGSSNLRFEIFIQEEIRSRTLVTSVLS